MPKGAGFLKKVVGKWKYTVNTFMGDYIGDLIITSDSGGKLTGSIAYNNLFHTTHAIDQITINDSAREISFQYSALFHTTTWGGKFSAMNKAEGTMTQGYHWSMVKLD